MSIRDTYTEDVEYVRSILDELAESATDREFTEDEQSRWDEGRAFVTETVAKIEAIDAREAQRAELAALAIAKPERQERAVPEAVNVNLNRSPFDLSDVPSDPIARSTDLKARALTAIERASWHADDHGQGATEKIEMLGNSGRAAELVLAGVNPDYLSAFGKWMARNEGIDVESTPSERAAEARANEVFRATGFFEQTESERALALTNVTGKLVPSQLDTTIISTNAGALNPYRQIARVIPVSTNVWTGVTSAGITGGWTGSEASEVDDDTPTFVNPTVTCAMADAFLPMSFQAFEDWSMAASELQVMLQEYKDVLEEAAFTSGSGSAQPLGIITALMGTSSHVSCTTNSSFTSADLFRLKQALGARYKAGAAFVMNEAYEDRIRQFGTNDGALYTVDLTETAATRILGKPSYNSSTMSSALSTVTQPVIVYGDWSNFVIADRIGMAVEFIPNLFHTNANRPSASRGYLAHWRVGSDSINDGGFKMLVNQGVH